MNQNNQQPGSADLPPLPDFFAFGKTRINGVEHGHYSASQMQKYARDAIAASRRAAPSLPDVAMPEPIYQIYDLTRQAYDDVVKEDFDSEPADNRRIVYELAAQPAEGIAQVARTEQDQSIDLNVAPPFAAPASLQDAANWSLADAIAYGYESGTYKRGYLDLAGEITLHYQSPAEAENAFEAITDAIDAARRFRAQGGNTQSQQEPGQQMVLPERSDTPAAEGATQAGEGIPAGLKQIAKLVEVGKLVEVPDGQGEQANTIICEWYPDRYRLPAGTILYGRIDGDKQGAPGEKA